jgi:hypothetical protein
MLDFLFTSPTRSNLLKRVFTNLVPKFGRFDRERVYKFSIKDSILKMIPFDDDKIFFLK